MESKIKILIVDDEPSILEYIGTVLEKTGYDVISCQNGADVMKLAQEQNPALILLDIMLPDIDGITVCRRVKSNPQTMHIPVIIVTSLTDAATVQDAHLFGAYDYLSKPFDDKVLREKVSKIVLKNSPQ